MGRSILVVAGGFAAIMASVIAGTFIATLAFMPGGASAMLTPPPPGTVLPFAYLASNLLVSFGGAVLGGWLAARFAKASPMGHAAAVAGIMLLMSVPELFRADEPNGPPGWYRPILPLLGVTGAFVGGWLHAMHQR